MDANKKFIIVEFSDGLQIIPARWLNTTKETCIWPSHFKTQRRINTAIITEEMPKQLCDWEELPLKRIFGSAGDRVKKNFMYTYVCVSGVGGVFYSLQLYIIYVVLNHT